MSLRILHVTEDYSRRNTGITATINQLTGWLVERCDWVGVYSTGKPDVKPAEGVCLFYDDDFIFPSSWRLPKGMVKRLTHLIQENNVQMLHLHGLWRAAPWAAQRVAQQLGIPTVLTIHGQMEPWAWSGQGYLKAIKKKFYWAMMARRAFKNVTTLHAITGLEKKHMARCWYNRPIHVVPNAIDLSDVLSDTIDAAPERILLFLGRIHPVKGIELILQAVSTLGLDESWKLVVCGPVEDLAYYQHLNALVVELKLTSQVEFIGAVDAADKWQWLQKTWVLIQPSYMEVIGLVNLEAASCWTPGITTFQTGLLDWEQGGGYLVEPNVTSLAEKLKLACAWSLEERLKRGSLSRALIEKNYSLDVVGDRWLFLYQETMQEAHLADGVISC